MNAGVSQFPTHIPDEPFSSCITKKNITTIKEGGFLIQIKIDENCKKWGANIYGFWALESDYLNAYKYFEKDQTYWETNPGVLFVGRLTRYSRSRESKGSQ